MKIILFLIELKWLFYIAYFAALFWYVNKKYPLKEQQKRPGLRRVFFMHIYTRRAGRSRRIRKIYHYKKQHSRKHSVKWPQNAVFTREFPPAVYAPPLYKIRVFQALFWIPCAVLRLLAFAAPRIAGKLAKYRIFLRWFECCFDRVFCGFFSGFFALESL